MARRHYIPVWLLKQFRPASPWTLDTITGDIRELGLKKVGQVEDAWSKEIENEIMDDSRPAEIFYGRIAGRQRIGLTKNERNEFAKWLCLFAYRVPDSYAFVERHWAEIKADKTKLRDHLSSARPQLLAELQKDNPELYHDVIQSYGKEEGERVIFNDLIGIVFERSNELLAPADRVWHHNIRNSTLERDAEYLSRYHWTWFYCRHGLVIGDNPLVRWSPKEHRSYRHVNRSGVEITFPLGTNLCLHIQQAHRGDGGRRQIASKVQCRDFNRRQRLASTRFVYAGHRELLEPLAEPRPRHEHAVPTAKTD